MMASSGYEHGQYLQVACAGKDARPTLTLTRAAEGALGQGRRFASPCTAYRAAKRLPGRAR